MFLSLNENIKIDKQNVLKTYIFLQLLKNGKKVFENDLDILVALYFFNGYKGKEGKKIFYNHLIKNDLLKSENSISNKLSEFNKEEFIFRNSKNSVSLNKIYFPEFVDNLIGAGLILKMYNAI